MMIKKDYEKDLISQILAMLEQGRSKGEIAEKLKADKTRNFLDLIEKIEKFKENVIPDRRILEAILKRAEYDVTAKGQNRFDYRGKGRAFIWLIKIKNKINSLMEQSTLKKILPIGAIVIFCALAAFSVFQNQGEKSEKSDLSVKEMQMAENKTSIQDDSEAAQDINIVLPEATGKVSDVVAAIEKESGDELSYSQGEDEVADLVTADSQEIVDFDQLYDEQDF